ncbi:LacI family DNA-binding transcriptional regulator [Gluconacetobacter diazotrophicus]|uniref:Putative transcriptional regulator protein, family lacI n=1 Tax=Gluconacetobacter diazotrophicus (strain ATCC 49037 / DSM 5601 / CCUG 37298 / CIP 103539 / LMG 7603 / PAl5) TaxID=272568 RepID=A9H565_GLUDA|nr:LacI family DNA-binding transcriptional regulator [Gluconacetobacter diazotrophicus]CAP54293.1 putative transcriptional regulator protein, family lacI [Gluconacetobacter diazotrophicus PA1 5]
MTHMFPIKDIAHQAGLSMATVDRVLNARAGVSRQTGLRVRAAIAELERQEARALLPGRKMTIDVLMEAPRRFTTEARAAFEAEMAAFVPLVFRCRFHLMETEGPAALARAIDRIRLRGTDGMLVKVPDTPVIHAAVARAAAAGITVVTFVTDLPSAPRAAYVGVDNRAAGETAAYLVGRALGAQAATVLVTISSSRFRGEGDREKGFRTVMRACYPSIRVTSVCEGRGQDAETGRLVHDALAADPTICAIYSIGGGNRATLDACREMGRAIRIFVAHDLDADNRALLAGHAIDFVLYHNLRADARAAFDVFRHGAFCRGESVARLSSVEIVTPYNLPVSPPDIGPPDIGTERQIRWNAPAWGAPSG